MLAGTVVATGPGLLLTITDPEERIGPEVLLDALEELRAAGAEAVQLEGPVDLSVDPAEASVGEAVRVVASTALVEGPEGGVEVDGTVLYAPYRFVVVGDPGTLASARGHPRRRRRQRPAARRRRARRGARTSSSWAPCDGSRTPRYARPAPTTAGRTRPERTVTPST